MPGEKLVTRYRTVVRSRRTRGRIQRKNGPYAGVDYNSPYVHSRVNSNTFTMGNPMPESILTLCQSRLYPPVRDFGFGLSTVRYEYVVPSFSPGPAGGSLRISIKYHMSRDFREKNFASTLIAAQQHISDKCSRSGRYDNPIP